MSANRLVRRGVLIVVLLAAVIGIVPSTSSQPVVAQSAGLGAGGEYHPLTPTRILDTRRSALDVAPAGKKPTSPGDGRSFAFPVLGKGGVPRNADKVLAVVVSIVVADADSRGNLSLYPTGAAAGQSSLVNFVPGQAAPNLAIVGVGNGGKVTARLRTGEAGRAHVIADVFGWISTSSATERGSRVFPITPARIYDSRLSGGPLGSGASVPLQIRGADGRNANNRVIRQDVVPDNTSVKGVIVNLTAINRLPGSTATFMSLTPQAVRGSRPGTSNINALSGVTKPVMAIVPVGPDGKIHLYNNRGPAHAVVDVLGYLQLPGNPASTRGRIVPLDSPFRVFDTRLPEFGQVPLGTKQAENWSFKAFAQSVTLDGAPIGAQSSLFGNLTGVDLQRRVPWEPVETFLSIYPGNVARPNTSNINVQNEREAVPNMALVRFGTVDRNPGDSVPPDPYVAQAFNNLGSLHYLLDVFAVVLK